MFRRLVEGLPKDPAFPADLTALGYKITDTGSIRKINNPEEGFQFFVSNVTRYNEVHKEAFNTVQRWTLDELARLGICRLHLPQLSAKNPHDKHVSILCHPPEVLRHRKRVLVVVNDSNQDLGIWSYRWLGEHCGLVEGTAVGVAIELLKRSAIRSAGEWNFVPSFKSQASSNKIPSRYKTSIKANEESKKFLDQDKAWGLIVLNPGQLLYSHNLNSAISYSSWNSLPRPSAVHPPVRKDIDENFVEGNETPEEHIDFVFERILSNPDLIALDAKFYIVVNGGVGGAVASLLDRKWNMYKDRMNAIVFTQPPFEAAEISNREFADFLKLRARSYETSAEKIDTLLAAPEVDDTKADVRRENFIAESDTASNSATSELTPRKVVCPTFSGGVDPWEELLLPMTYTRILDFFEENVTSY